MGQLKFKGSSLVEVVVAMALLSIVVLGVSATLFHTQRSFQAQWMDYKILQSEFLNIEIVDSLSEGMIIQVDTVVLINSSWPLYHLQKTLQQGNKYVKVESIVYNSQKIK